MFRVAGGKVEHKKLICSVVAVKTRKFRHIAVPEQIPLSESCHCPAGLEIQTGYQ